MGREGKLLLLQYIARNSSWLADNSTARKAKRLQHLAQTSCERVAVRLVRQPCVLLALHNRHHHHLFCPTHPASGLPKRSTPKAFKRHRRVPSSKRRSGDNIRGTEQVHDSVRFPEHTTSSDHCGFGGLADAFCAASSPQTIGKHVTFGVLDRG
ncbi:hypothetical protein CSHISOI_01485, partial [Colletotrichum shisoi]